jgi:hypothetical protein
MLAAHLLGLGSPHTRQTKAPVLDPEGFVMAGSGAPFWSLTNCSIFFKAVSSQSCKARTMRFLIM